MLRKWTTTLLLFTTLAFSLDGYQRKEECEKYKPTNSTRLTILGGLGGLFTTVLIGGGAGYAAGQAARGRKGSKGKEGAKGNRGDQGPRGEQGPKGDPGKDFERGTSEVLMEISVHPPSAEKNGPDVDIEVYDPTDQLLGTVTLNSGSNYENIICTLGGEGNPTTVGMYKIIFRVQDSGEAVSDFGAITLHIGTRDQISFGTPMIVGDTVQYTLNIQYPRGQITPY